MKQMHIKLLLTFIFLGSLMACSKDDKINSVNIPGLGGETWEKGPIDFWIDSAFTKPYNIEVKYRFERYELTLDKTLVPVKEEKVEPVMSTILKTWAAPYIAEAGETFFKTYCQKQFVLVGSPQFNSNNTITLGTAEGGRKIVLFWLNDFSLTDKPFVREMLHTIHHEFAHILHQTIMYPVEYKRISTGYTGSWNDYTLDEALARGFITQYARSAPDEDFVEMVATMLVEGKTGYQAIVASAPADAQVKFQQKEAIIVRYFKESWNIDFYNLQSRVQDAINHL
ncbi:zinc-binding metallopeptidase [Chitinophaga ginsengisoli]|uniref:Substrate import-associated zinc metallohydrolase lipoprotein n=1 Tax=Chitinophaga ginsengisoli TaxID=363837 RepID=A0A2P8G0J6_9BACT|nr:putative zinc-binding metallopeptidase [Chitinophaga ginsengisoli]PSL27503.1 substrate import-associated zinc metallohydrolase lipoprotein [Chitinophaga ginsengisoli]